MRDSEQKFQIKVSGQFSKFCLHQQLFTFKEFCMEKRMSNIFKTTNIAKLTKTILKSSCRVLQVTSKWKTLKKTCLFLRAVEFQSTFYIQISINLAIFSKKLQNCTFQKSHRSLSKHANIHINRGSLYEVTDF